MLELKQSYFKGMFPGVDDTLDVFMSHGMCGMLGCFLLGFFSSTDANPGGEDGVFFGGKGWLLGYQVAAIVATAAYSSVVTYLILIVLKYTIGLTYDTKKISEGLDKHVHDHTETSDSDIALDIKDNRSTYENKTTDTDNGNENTDNGNERSFIGKGNHNNGGRKGNHNGEENGKDSNQKSTEVDDSDDKKDENGKDSSSEEVVQIPATLTNEKKKKKKQ